MAVKSFADIFGTVEIDGKTLTNLFTDRFAVNQKYVSNVAYYELYIVNEADRPDIIAHKFFGDASLWWLVCLFNDIYDPFYGLPVDESVISDNVERTVAQLDAQKDKSGWTQEDHDAWEAEKAALRTELSEKLSESNDATRTIKIPRAEFIYDIVKEISEAFGEK